jgi:hypothetical protein
MPFLLWGVVTWKTTVLWDVAQSYWWCTSETSVNFYESTRRNMPEDSLHSRHHENLKSHHSCYLDFINDMSFFYWEDCYLALMNDINMFNPRYSTAGLPLSPAIFSSTLFCSIELKLIDKSFKDHLVTEDNTASSKCVLKNIFFVYTWCVAIQPRSDMVIWIKHQ